LASKAYKAQIVAFMRAHWGQPHQLIEDDNYFNYYYKAQNGNLRFVLCLYNGNIAALAGFIPASSLKIPDIWVSLWLADKNHKGAGLELIEKMPQLCGCRILACNNIRPKTRAFYEFLGYTTGRLGHFYRIIKTKNLQICKIENPAILPRGGTAFLKHLCTAQDLKQSGFIPPKNTVPYKDLKYITKRYFSFPGWKYMLYAASMPGQKQPFALLALRINQIGESCAVRIVDYIGAPEQFCELGAAIDDILINNGAEYADIYCTGIESKTLLKAGFCERRKSDENVIIPNYLTPPVVYENVEFYYFTNTPANFTMFKADGDGDRPPFCI
jgi:hypothetical protein